MVKFYVSMIKRGRMKLEDVPAVWRKEVSAELKK